MTTTPMTPRVPEFTRALLYKETSRGVDPGSPVGYVAQHRGEATYAAKQGTTSNPAFKGNVRSDDASYDPFDCSGSLPMWLDFDTSPLLFATLASYTRIPLATGSLHRMWVPAGVVTPASLQVQYEFLQSTARYMRQRNSWVKSLGLSLPTKGGVPLDCDFVGSGDTAFTDLGGTKTDNPYTSVTSFNSTVKVAGYTIQGLADLKWMLTTNAMVDPVPTNAGVGIPRTGAINVMTNLALRWASAGGGLEQDFTLLNLGLAQSTFATDFLWANLPILLATKWCRVIQPNNIATVEPTVSGGTNGKTVKATIRMQDRGAKVAAEAFGTTKGPYAIVTGTNDKFSVAPDGGATVTVTLAANASLTVDALVALLNADGGFAAKFIADNFNGFPRVTSLQTGGTGASSSVAFDTTVVHHCGTTMGFVSTVIPGVDTNLLVEFYNLQNSNY